MDPMKLLMKKRIESTSSSRGKRARWQKGAPGEVFWGEPPLAVPWTGLQEKIEEVPWFKREP